MGSQEQEKKMKNWANNNYNKNYSFGIFGSVLLGAIPIYLIGKPNFLFPLPV